MGTWSEKIKDNDTTLDIYSSFYEHYNSGETPTSSSKSVKGDYEDYFNDSDDRNNSLIGLALAQWETKSLESKLFEQVKGLITTGSDLKIWKGLGADEKSLRRRNKELEKFLELISFERPKAKRRMRPKLDITINEILRAISPDSKKEFVIQDEYTNGKYVHTSGIINWFSGGGAGILYYDKPNSLIKATWTDAQTVEVVHQVGLNFDKKEVKAYFCGDEVIFKYKGK